MILSAANCIASPLKTRGDVRFASRLRSDVLLAALVGSAPRVDYEELEGRGFACYRIRDYSDCRPDVFLWSPYVDANCVFRDIGGVPFHPRSMPDTPDASKEWLAETYAKCAPLSWAVRCALAAEVDTAVTRLNPAVRKILVIYETSVLVERCGNGDEAHRALLRENSIANSVISSVLAPLGWEILFEPYGLPKRSSSWSHSDFARLGLVFESAGLLSGEGRAP